jgi:transposase
LLFDQLKAVIIDDQRPDGGRVIENPEFLRFAVHWGFRIRACRPYRARTKGKVERPVGYVRRSLVYGREFLDDADLNAQAADWLKRVANVRVHGTTPASRPYQSLIWGSPEPRSRSSTRPAITVERRPLAVYAELVGAKR